MLLAVTDHANVWQAFWVSTHGDRSPKSSLVLCASLAALSWKVMDFSCWGHLMVMLCKSKSGIACCMLHSVLNRDSPHRVRTSSGHLTMLW